MPPSASAKAPHPISHSTTLTLALVSSLLVSAVGVALNYATTQADVRYQARDIEQVKKERERDSAQISEQGTQLRLVIERMSQQKLQMDRMEEKLDRALSLPASSTPRRIPLTQSTPP